MLRGVAGSGVQNSVEQRVLVLEVSGRERAWGLLEGVLDFFRRTPRWQIRLLRSIQPVPYRAVAETACDGIILIDARADEALFGALCEHERRPVVCCGSAEPGLPTVTHNDRRIGELAAEHFLDLRLRHTAFLDDGRGGRHANDRYAGFAARVAACGGDCARYRGASGPASINWWQFDRELGELGAWLRALPKPVGLLCFTDDMAERALEACRLVAVRVPDEVAILGIGNDEVLCEFSNPPLSSIAADRARVGLESAALLQRLMSGQAPPAGQVLIDPLGVVPRLSTNLLAVADEDVARAVAFIHQHVGRRRLEVAEVAQHVALSRASLDRRFRAALGRTPAEEIRRTMLRRAKDFLSQTDQSLLDIAADCGYADSAQLARAIRQHTGMTPTAYRQRFRRS